MTDPSSPRTTVETRASPSGHDHLELQSLVVRELGDEPAAAAGGEAGEQRLAAQRPGGAGDVRPLAARLRAQRPAARRAAGPHAVGGEHAVDGEVGTDDEGHDPPGSAGRAAAPQRLRCTYPLPSEILTLVSSAAEKPLNALQDAVGLRARGQRGDAGPAADHRDELRVDAVLRDLGAHEHRLGGLAAEAAEHEVAEAVEDEPAVVGLHAVEQVRVVREHDVRAGVDRRLALALLEVARGALVLEVPVPADDHVVGLLLGRLDRRSSRR